MRLIAVLMTIGLVSCGVENDTSDNNKQEEAKPVQQVTNESSVPSAHAQNMPKTLIARVEVDANGEIVGKPETRGFEGSTSQFANGDATIASAFEGSQAITADDLDKNSSSSQCRGNCYRNNWYYYNTSYYNSYYYPSSYYRYYYYQPTYSSYSYVNYSYSNYYSYNNYRYYCYSPYYY